MTNPTQTFQSLKNAYLRYFDSPYDLRFEEIVQARRQLLDRDGVLYREPLVEPQPPYAGSGLNIRSAVSTVLSGAAGWTPAMLDDLASIAERGLFPPRGGSPLEMYRHQVEMFGATTVRGEDAVILTGTGSGKTESIYLPVLAALARESQRWPAIPVNPANQWWSMPAPAGSGNRRHHPRISQRAHEPAARMPAVRALVLYPLNALAEDQMARLRFALDGDDVRTWLANHRPGNRFWFGRYTGWTPISGRPDRDGAEGELRGELLRLSQMADDVRGTGAQRFFPRFDGGEMWSRWDMQDAPPDILITNYSMLNIMLMRDVETSIFDATKRWLEADAANVFHLVVDELHTYRGTPGTEVGYMLRVLYRRLGLHPDHPQLRILASSASLGDDPERAQDYLRQFFGRSRPFSLIRGGALPLAEGAELRLRAMAAPITALGQAAERSPDQLDAPISTFADAVGANADENLPTAQRLGALLNEIGATEAVRAACNSGSNTSPTIEPRTMDALGAALFPDSSTGEATAAASALVSALAPAKQPDGSPVLPVRIHLFFRNVQGVWACTNPRCSETNWTNGDIPIGRLFDRPTTTCRCGSRVLEMLYCEPCGDIFLGGYRRDTQPNVWTLVPDDPNIENAPDHSASDRNYESYGVYWPARTADGSLRQPQRDRWRQEGVNRRWQKAAYDHRTGDIQIAQRTADATGWIYHVPDLHRVPVPANANVPSARNERPSVCPHCEADWSRMENAAPIRSQRTGFQKIAQVLSDSLLREIAPIDPSVSPPPEDPRRKLVLFSDSRQDAAKLSVGVAKSHWQDALRQTLVEAMGESGRAIDAYVQQLNGGALTPAQSILASRFATSRPLEAQALLSVRIPALRNNPSGLGGLTMQQLADQVVAQSTAGLTRVTDLEAEAGRRLLTTGMNPGGVDRSVTWTDPDEHNGKWQRLFDWSLSPPDYLPALAGSETLHRQRIQDAARESVAETLFSGGRRDLESLKLAYVTTDRTRHAAPTPTIQQAADSCIRLLGKRRRIDTHRATVDDPRLPKYARDYLEAIANANGFTPANFESDVTQFLTSSGAFDRGLIVFRNLFIISVCDGAAYYQCTQCSRIHLHQSGSVCSNCHTRLNTPGQVGDEHEDQDIDYYRWLAVGAGPVFRLNCAELTGQTDKLDARDRQRQFQNIPVAGEAELTDNVDLLSVTTTMEAGVDIGSLLAVMMANMPPMRFNYQQRVGRAGRRGAALSIALTLCRGRSHDDYYFQRPERITADPPPPPYVDTARAQILRRVLAKEVLRAAFDELDLFANSAGDSVHGEFGESDAWSQAPTNPPAGYSGGTVSAIVQQWIGAHQQLIGEICDDLLVGTRLAATPAERDNAVQWVIANLVQAVTDATLDQSLVQDGLSERLANKGILPMFGFPTRARLLYHKQPNQWPARHTVDRDLELAISMFAPGAETVKERTIHTAIGIAHYKRQGPFAVAQPNPLGPAVRIGLCGNCQHVETANPDSAACPLCSRPSGADDRDYRPMNLHQPKGFISYFTRARDYDGVFDFVPRAARPKVGRPPFPILPNLNFEVGAGQGRLHVINDNAGRLFHLSQEPWAGQHAMIDVEAANNADDKHAVANRTRPTPRQVNGPVVECALAAITETDMMLLGVQDYGPGRIADPRTPHGRAALYSLAFMLRRAAAVYLDIQDYELKAGIRSQEDPALGTVVGQVFLCDTLENGAGYATHLGTPAVTRDLLQMIAQPTAREFYNRLIHPSHADNCDTSCPDCLRSYSNLAYHNLLDWRLAIDMARLALDPSAHISLADPLWSRISDVAAATLAAARPTHRRTTIAGLPAITDGAEVLIVTHPLWQNDRSALGPELAAAWDEAERVQGLAVDPRKSFVSVFEALRRPA